MINVFKEKFKMIYNGSKDILDELKYKRVLNIYTEEDDNDDKINHIILEEGCDTYYKIYITRNDCLQLAKFFNALSDIANESETVQP
jgi:predicted double-glycine peptidase